MRRRKTSRTKGVKVDRYVVDVLLRDLVGHDAAPSAFLVYLFLLTRQPAAGSGHRLELSLRQIADETGLSKSAVEQSLRVLRRRQLIKSEAKNATAVRTHAVLMPWREQGK